MNTILANLGDIKVYPIKELQDTTDGAQFDDDHLKDLKKSVQKNCPIGPSIEKHLPTEYRSGKKAECIGQIIYWIMCQDAKDPNELNDYDACERFRKEVLTRYGHKDMNYTLYVEEAWGEYHVHLGQCTDMDICDFIIMKFSLK